MIYANNDLWSVRQIEFLEDALKGYENKRVKYYPKKEVTLNISGIATYNYVGVLHFEELDRTIILEQGEKFGLTKKEVLDYLNKLNIEVEVINE